MKKMYVSAEVYFKSLSAYADVLTASSRPNVNIGAGTVDWGVPGGGSGGGFPEEEGDF